MPYMVNGQIVPEELIQQESTRIGRDSQWQGISDTTERARQLRAAAESSAADRVLVEQFSAMDPRPVDLELLEAELNKLKTQWGCRAGFNDSGMRPAVERQLRIQRTNRDMVAAAEVPSAEEVEAFYNENCQSFHKPELFHAAYIVKYVNDNQNLDQAHSLLEPALAELERGEPFSEVADRYSDCKDKGGDLGQFPAGHMVEEFEQVLRSLEPGQRSGIFATPFGLHIAELRALSPAGMARLGDVRAEIERVMTFASRHEAYTCAVARLREKADIRWVPPPNAATA